MKDCLVTTYPVDVATDLGLYKKLIIRATSATKVACWLTSKSAQTVSILNPLGAVISTYNLEANTRANVRVSDMSGLDYVDIVIPNKYDLSLIYTHNNPSYGGSEDAQYTMDGRNLNYAAITSLAESMRTFVTHPESVVILPDVEMIDISINDGTHQHFLPNEIFYNTHLNTLRQPEDAGVSKSSVDLKDLIEWMCAHGRISGTLAIQFYYLNDWTFGDAGVMNYKVVNCVFSNTGCVITNVIGFFYATATYNKTTGTWTYVDN